MAKVRFFDDRTICLLTFYFMHNLIETIIISKVQWNWFETTSFSRPMVEIMIDPKLLSGMVKLAELIPVKFTWSPSLTVMESRNKSIIRLFYASFIIHFPPNARS